MPFRVNPWPRSSRVSVNHSLAPAAKTSVPYSVLGKIHFGDDVLFVVLPTIR